MERDPNSHKGDNGSVAVIGGSALMHGAPLFSAKAAEHSGADLVFTCVPHCHTEIAKQQSLNFQVRPFAANELYGEDVEPILELLASMDSAVIGPGIAREAECIRACTDVIASAACPLVLDATALQPTTLQAISGRDAILTPHLGELERMELTPEDLPSAAQTYGCTFLLKGVTDRLVSYDGTDETIAGGNAGLTVGGTGDSLAGLIGGLLSQGWSTTDACRTASRVMKRAGTVLYHDLGNAYTTEQVISRIQPLLKTI